MLFVDTGAWFALSIPSDPDHEAAQRFIDGHYEPLVTTDYIVDELLTLFTVRNEKVRGVRWVHDVLAKVDLVRIGTDDFDAACRIYSSFADKQWSFTDCTSYAVIRSHQIQKAFSFDNHFREFGIVEVVP